jgi:hypothetical protein
MSSDEPSNELPGAPVYPGHDLPEAPVFPGHDLPSGGGGRPSQGLPGGPAIPGHLPAPPPGVWPPLMPSAPIQPAPPGTPPGSIWPPVNPPHPDVQPPTGPPPVAGTPLPEKTYWLIAGIPGVGWRYVAVDPSLVAGMPLPPTAEPK